MTQDTNGESNKLTIRHHKREPLSFKMDNYSFERVSHFARFSRAYHLTCICLVVYSVLSPSPDVFYQFISTCYSPILENIDKVYLDLQMHNCIKGQIYSFINIQ